MANGEEYGVGKRALTGVDTAPGGLLYLKLEPIKVELTFTGGLTIDDYDVLSASNTEAGSDYRWVFGSAVLTGLIGANVILQFVEYDPVTECETNLWHGKPIITSTTEMHITYLGEEERKYDESLMKTRTLSRNLKDFQSNPQKRHNKPRLKMYMLPPNYVTKQINVSSIQSYWQDPEFTTVMWVQHTSCCSFTTGPFSPRLRAGEGENPAELTQPELRSKAATGVEVFHNIIPLLDKIMTYAN